MKLRTGFVSNSSSSSFVLIASKEAFDNAMKDLTADEKSAVKLFITSGKFLNKDVNIFGFAYNDNTDFIVSKIEDHICDKNNISNLEEFILHGFPKLLQKCAKNFGGCVKTEMDF